MLLYNIPSQDKEFVSFKIDWSGNRKAVFILTDAGFIMDFILTIFSDRKRFFFIQVNNKVDNNQTSHAENHFSQSRRNSLI